MSKVRCHTVVMRGNTFWIVEVDRPVEDGGPSTHAFQHDEVFAAARMANKWRKLLGEH